MGASKTVPGIEDHLEKINREESFHCVSFADMVEHPLYQSWINQEDFGNGIDFCESIVRDTNRAPIALQNDDDRVTVSFAKPPNNVLRALLHVHGMDVNKNYDEEMCWHRRPSNGLPAHTLRFSGVVRKDKTYRTLVKQK